MITRARIFIVALLAVALVGVVAAQDDPEGPTLESVTGTEDYYGQTVTLEGVVREFVGSRIFVLHEDVTVDDDAVLVINMGPEIDMSVVTDTRLQVTGTIQPSLQYITDNELSAPIFTPAEDAGTDMDTDMEPTAEMVEPTMEGDMEPTVEGEADAEVPTVDADMDLTVTPEGEVSDMEATIEGEEPTMEGEMEMTAMPEGEMMEPTVEGEADMEPTMEGDMEPTVESDMEATPEMDASDDMMSIPDVVNFYYAGNLPENFDSFTILIIDATSDITIVPQDTE
jgi:hypothetical protein